ncbi:MAG: GTP-binding protein [Paraburkholderia fungorum]|uniref:GTP-binding protein n=1 Tax=Paraburkholderia agricolaris TaxID=2152888 RepID=UPI0012928076|nr:GTP-binding protein [Paraburkholderia agricolaris]MDE1007136.1 GTP-binding protein [Paraburkholderia fungorum]
MSTQRSPTQFVILAGKLGSGKTSLLEALLESSDATSTTGIIVNEVGAVNIDGAVLSQSARGISIATLSNGCVCCSLTNDLVTTVEDLVASREEQSAPPFERIILECSGLSRPGQVMGSLAQLSQLGLRVQIVATYDCSRPPLSDDDFDDAVAQLTAAHSVVLTKVDLVSAEMRVMSVERARGLNPLANIVNETTLTIRARAAFRPTENLRDVTVPASESRQGTARALFHPRVGVFRARFLETPDWEHALDWFENIAGAMGDRLLRMKSIIADPWLKDRVLLQSVGSTFAAPRRITGSDLPDMSAVFIVRDCSMEELEAIPTECDVRWTSL